MQDVSVPNTGISALNIAICPTGLHDNNWLYNTKPTTEIATRQNITTIPFKVTFVNVPPKNRPPASNRTPPIVSPYPVALTAFIFLTVVIILTITPPKAAHNVLITRNPSPSKETLLIMSVLKFAMIIPANPNRQPKILFEVSLYLKNNTARNISQKVPRESIIDALLPLQWESPI